MTYGLIICLCAQTQSTSVKITFTVLLTSTVKTPQQIHLTALITTRVWSQTLRIQSLNSFCSVTPYLPWHYILFKTLTNRNKQKEQSQATNPHKSYASIMLDGMYAHMFGMHCLRVHIVQLCLCHLIQL